MSTIYERMQSALAGQPVIRPVYAVYDWFVRNRPHVDWPALFDLGLGQINHVTLTAHEHPYFEIVETLSEQNGQPRRDVRWVTDDGELHEWYLGEWRQEYLIKSPGDCRTMVRALRDVKILPAMESYTAASADKNSIAIGQPVINRTAFQKIQIDYVGLEQFSVAVAEELPELFELVDVMNDLQLREFEAIAKRPVPHLKLWENLSIETMGPRLYRRHLMPVYRRIADILARSGQRLCVHYDGKLRMIAPEIQELPFDMDSLTPPPEGDLTIAEARRLWLEKFLWLHPPLGWYDLPEKNLRANIRQMIRDAGPSRFCLMISEEVPENWRQSLPVVLEEVNSACPPA